MTLSDKYSAYLPYKVRCVYGNTKGILISVSESHSDDYTQIELTNPRCLFTITKGKLILKPLDTIDWAKCRQEMSIYIDTYWEKFIGYDNLTCSDLGNAPYLLVQWLLKNHYDVFEMIELGEAIEKKPKLPDTETLLNIALNKALVSKNKITNPDSNKIAQFIIDLLNQYEQ